MRKLVIVDYIGNCDNKGEVTGHAVKTLSDSIGLLNNSFEIALMLTPAYVQHFSDFKGSMNILSYQSDPQSNRNIFAKLRLVLNKMRAIKKAIKLYDNVWFLNTDRWLYISLLLTKVDSKKKIYITNYLDFYHGNSLKRKIQNIIYKKATRKVKAVFTTCSDVALENHYHIPDYWFKASDYEKYIKNEKMKVVYVCGGINPGKNIEGLINVFNKNKQHLRIHGKFSEQALLETAINTASENIEIISERMNSDEYYEELGKYCFVALPYKKEYYDHRSSGVILEAIFLGATIIGPKFLLDQLGIAGIKYDDISELDTFNIDNFSEKEIIDYRKINQKMIREYDYETIKKLYLDVTTGSSEAR